MWNKNINEPRPYTQLLADFFKKCTAINIGHVIIIIIIIISGAASLWRWPV